MTPERGDDSEKQNDVEPTPDEDIRTVGSMTDDDDLSMDQAFDDEAIKESLRSVRPGEIVSGTIVEVRGDEVVVHVGGKYEGVIPLIEFPSRAEVPPEGATVDVAVIRVADEEGQVVLSKKKADYEAVWTRILNALKTKEIVTAMVTERVKGGLRVDLGVSGFVPASQVSTRNVRDLDRFVGRSLRLRVIEADRREKKVILSHRQVVEEERADRRSETLDRLCEGMVCEGKVRNITDYGTFVDLGGVDGLLHISEMAWTRVKHPSEVVKVGDTLQVAIIGIDREKERISLSRRECLPDPWNEAASKLKAGQIVKAKITRLARNGAFALIEGMDIEGFVPISELADRRVGEPGEVVQPEQVLDLKVISLRPQERRMTLSLAEAEQEKERQEYREYMAGQSAAKPTLGDQFGDVLSQVQAATPEAPQSAPDEGTGPITDEPAAEPAAEDVSTEQPDADTDAGTDEPAAEAMGDDEAGEISADQPDTDTDAGTDEPAAESTGEGDAEEVSVEQPDPDTDAGTDEPADEPTGNEEAEDAATEKQPLAPEPAEEEKPGATE